MHPKPSIQELEEYYKDAAFYQKAESEEARLVAEAASRIKMLSHLADNYGLTKRLLDVGCASGIFLEQAQKHGWDISGIELSEALTIKARNRGIPTINEWIDNLPHGEKYSVVTAWEVLEHTPEPVKFFESLGAHVSPGGLIALSTPLSTGLPAKFLGPRFPMICPPEHISLFSKMAITILANRHGFNMVRCRSFSNLDKQSLNRGLLKFILRPIGIPTSIATRLSPLLAIPIIPLAKLMDLLGMGSELEIVFRHIK